MRTLGPSRTYVATRLTFCVTTLLFSGFRTFHVGIFPTSCFPSSTTPTRNWLFKPAALGLLSNHLEAEHAIPLGQQDHSHHLPRCSKVTSSSGDGKVDHCHQLSIAAIGLLTPVEFSRSVRDGFRKAAVDGSVEDARSYHYRVGLNNEFPIPVKLGLHVAGLSV